MYNIHTSIEFIILHIIMYPTYSNTIHGSHIQRCSTVTDSKIINHKYHKCNIHTNITYCTPIPYFTSTYVTPMRLYAIWIWYRLLSLTVFTFKSCPSLRQITTKKPIPQAFKPIPQVWDKSLVSMKLANIATWQQMMHVQSKQSYAIKKIRQS